MLASHLGEIAALCTAVFWTITAISFEQAAKRLGSLALNWIRLIMGVVFLSVFTWIYRGQVFPVDATGHMWLWLSVSGLIGFTFGDLCLFQAFVMIGSRIAMLIMALVPPLTALMSWAIMGEVLSLTDLAGMFLVIGGIALVVLERPADGKRIQLSHPVLGLLLAFGGALGQAIGLVLSKYGMGTYNAFSATQIRGFAGIIGFTILFFPLKKWGRVRSALHHKSGLAFASLGAFFGPFLGVSFSLLAVQHTEAGVASTIMSIVPVLIIPPAMLFFHERVTLKEILGALLAVGGVALLFIH
ncbi:DMT family transporter [candidate division KSB1 bacterium]|nr:DMT family transporter [candidate division KSB1 bacterium]